MGLKNRECVVWEEWDVVADTAINDVDVDGGHGFRQRSKMQE